MPDVAITANSVGNNSVEFYSTKEPLWDPFAFYAADFWY
jgi:hypothetical protein